MGRASRRARAGTLRFRVIRVGSHAKQAVRMTRIIYPRAKRGAQRAVGGKRKGAAVAATLLLVLVHMSLQQPRRRSLWGQSTG